MASTKTSRPAGRGPELRVARRPGLASVSRPRAAALLAIVAVALAAGVLCASASARPQNTQFAHAAAETNKAPHVSKQPAPVTVQDGQSASFTAAATGVPTPTVQWERSGDGGATWAPIEGATATTFTIASATVVESGNQFRARFKNVAGEEATRAVALTVQKAPAIIKQPPNITVEEGQNATFEATASGSPAPTIKWETSANGGKTWTNVSGGTSSQLTIVAAKTTLSGHEYRASFKNTLGEVTSQAATLTVQNAPKLTHQPAGLDVNEGQSATFEATATGFPTPTVQWQVSTDEGSTWSEVAGATASQLVIASANRSENGYRYRAVFVNAAGSVTSEAATLSVHGVPAISQQPLGVTVEVGEDATFEATATGLPTPTGQWEVSTDEGNTWTPISAATGAQLTIPDAQVSQNGLQYRDVFTNSYGKTASSAATLSVVTSHFSALAWGDNTYLQLGTGTPGSSYVPAPVSGLKFVTAVAAGGRHSLALLANGTVVAWGANGLGQLGDGETTASAVPVAVHGLSGVRAIAAGASHSLALLHDGTVMAWGDNESGQLGSGSSAEVSLLPVAVQGLSNVRAIAAGASFSLALLTNGTVVAWGENESGQLGSGSNHWTDLPVPVKRLTNVSAIAAGGEFALAALANGTVQAWGSNEWGQLGNSEVEEGAHNLPTPVEGVSGATSVAAGGAHALALLSDGTVRAWGQDSSGQLGNGTIESWHSTPVAVSGLAGVAAISAGMQDSAGLLSSGSVKTWGSNSAGVLGYGMPNGVSDVPVTVAGLSQAVSVSVGRSHMLAFGEPIPTVTSISPALGPAGGGSSVTITGDNFEEATSVRFGSAPAAGFTVQSPTSIVATAPPGQGAVDVTVTTPAGTSPPTAADRFTYQLAPSVLKLSLKAGPAVGGSKVTLTGSEFTGATAVSFGGVAAEYSVVSAKSIVAVSPPRVGGTVDVTVSNVAGTSAATSKDHFRYQPTVEAISPNAGSIGGGQSVTVSGRGFAVGSTATTFKFGKTKSKSVSCVSDTTCTVLAPAHEAGSVDVTATVNKAAGLANSPADLFTYG
jgi:alpha-tubulin suppressor-like RCC1 family protein